ncbi:hypothetical protein ABG79_00372 [Caloramator mitchellensis]|uniref:SHOCT domain-containing protein n=1 Tax=Caloramator mitchellensis TaxID=908809 RepID=A0A0R3JVJ0_CALMK|nr:SHOCT domain-containing protein [Caloramator mitchellensis]KRQ87571.1 hypothetical protein ABG79_00372 [Caloramator mitchellensis]
MHRGFGKGFPVGPGFGFDGRMIERGFGYHWIGPLVMLGLIILLLIAAYFIYKRYKINNNIALQILNRRFVAGEISEAEYIRKKELLLGKKIKKNRYSSFDVEESKPDNKDDSNTNDKTNEK